MQPNKGVRKKSADPASEIKECLFVNLPEKNAGPWGSRPHGCKDEGLPLAKAIAGRAV